MKCESLSCLCRWATLALLAVWPAVAEGGRISLKVDAAARFEAGVVSIPLQVENRGDAPAEAIRVRADLGDTLQQSVIAEQLAPGTRLKHTLEFSPAPAAPGRHTAVLAVSYLDLSGHPFTSLAYVPVVTGDPGYESVLGGTLENSSIGNSGVLRLTLAAAGSKPQKVHCRLILPDELGGGRPEATLQVFPGQPAVVHFDVTNRWATAGSRYRVFAVMDYLHGGLHQSEVAEAWIRIPGRPRMSRLGLRMGWVAVFLMSAVFVSLQFRSRYEPRD